jgi:hypothetical protein
MDCSEGYLYRLIADLHSEHPARVLQAQLYMQPGNQRLPCQIRIRPTAPSTAPYPAHCSWLIMKLDLGHVIAPVPWPIQSNPMASARKPTMESDLAMDFPLLPLAVRLAGSVSTLAGAPLSRRPQPSIEYNAGAQSKAEMTSALFRKRGAGRRSAAERGRFHTGLGDR